MEAYDRNEAGDEVPDDRLTSVTETLVGATVRSGHDGFERKWEFTDSNVDTLMVNRADEDVAFPAAVGRLAFLTPLRNGVLRGGSPRSNAVVCPAVICPVQNHPLRAPERTMATIPARRAVESFGHAATIFDSSGSASGQFCESICESQDVSC